MKQAITPAAPFDAHLRPRNVVQQAIQYGCAVIACLFVCCSLNAQTSISVNDFGAVPNDTIDDAGYIQQALTYAKQHNIKKVNFGAGRYMLKSTAATGLNACVGLTNLNGLQVTGVMVNNTPATWLVKYNPQLNNTVLPPHMRFDNCDSMTINGIAFDNEPQYATAGKVVEKGADYIKVEVYDGLPAVDGMACYTANIWDTTTKMLKKLPSLTFSEDITKENLYWQLTTSGSKRYMQMNSSRFAASVNVGDGLSWHFGAPTMFQLAINYCDDLTLNNILTTNIAGWGFQTMGCRNIASKHVVFKATGKQLAVGPRDAWKLNSCNGLVQIDSMYVEGVRWDGQNVHGPFYQVKAKTAYNKVRVFKMYTTVVPFINDSVSFWNGDTYVKRKAIGWTFEQNADNGAYGIMELNDSVPSFATTGTYVTVDAADIDQYNLTNTTFKNIAGCASVIKTSKAFIQNVTYEHIMYPAIYIGTEPYEGTFPQDILVSQCHFNASGWVSRVRTKGLIGIGNGVNNASAMGTIHFDSCYFSNAEVGIDASFAKKVMITNSTFTNVEQPYKISNCSIGELYLNNNTPY